MGFKKGINKLFNLIHEKAMINNLEDLRVEFKEWIETKSLFRENIVASRMLKKIPDLVQEIEEMRAILAAYQDRDKIIDNK